MQKEIFINATDNQHRIAIVEDGKLVELFVENDERERMVGDIYYGVVAKVMPGIQACFVDIGLEQDAFLHFSDIGSEFRDLKDIIDGEEIDAHRGDGEPPKPKSRYNQRSAQRTMLQRGQEIVVQIFKEPVGNKGVRVTTEVSLPGRFLVLMPYDRTIGVSRKIANFKEKRRLRRLAQSLLPFGYGIIIRTVAEGREEEVLRSDLQSLLKTWREIERTMKKSKAPALIHKDLNASSSVIRDLFSEDVSLVAVDSREMYRDIRGYVNLVSPHKADAIFYHKGRDPIFDAFGIEKQISQSMNRKVWLKSGGYIIIDHTEAMRVIDVNSGRYAAKSEQELNSLRTNLEAVKEIARQIRLQDLGGIIVVDFIDMDHEENKRKVFDEMRRELRKDRAKSTILPLTDFGLLQMTRQRIRESDHVSTSDVCPTCGGTGRVLSKTSMLTEIDRWLRRFRSQSKELRLLLTIHPSMAAFLQEGAISTLRRLMLKYFVRITIVVEPTISVDEFRFVSRKQNTDITKQFLG
jgi:ribonuclease G